MSEASRAVFLSYASQDLDAARRICEALRAAGVEVWFDQSELRGGEAWDRQIRRQIHDCALFIAVISAHSDSRAEGYFRREWRLAVERAGDMAEDAPFLLPVVIDDTPQARARVPDSFLQVQWMRLPGGATPPAFVERVRRLLAVDAIGAPAGAPPPAAQAARGVRDTRRRAWAWWLAASGGALVLVLAVWQWARPGLGRAPAAAPDAAAAPAVAAAPAAGQTRAGAAVPADSVAVLPFVNLSSDREQEYFSDGLSEELINLLAQVPELRVSARTSSFYFKGKSILVADAARMLGVANVLEGSVRKSGKTVRVTAQLVRAVDGYPVWSATYDRPLDDIFRIQDEIASSVISGLKVVLLGGQLPRASRSASTEAYTLYLQATAAMYVGASAADLRHARDLLQQALKLDPNFAPAWASLGANLDIDASLYGSLPTAQASAAAHDAINRALRLDPKLPEAHRALARLLFQLDWNWEGAGQEIRRAIELEPGNAESHRVAAYLYLTLGRFDEALAMIQQAIALDPLQAWNHLVLGYVTYRTGNFDVAEQAYGRALSLAPGSGKFHYVMGALMLARGAPQQALDEMRQETDPGFRQCGLPLALDALGRRAEADRALAIAEHDYGDRKAYLIALVYAGRHDSDRAFSWLDRAVSQRSGDLIYIKGDPLVRGLLPDPRYRMLMRTMRLPE
jgi:TolB-like protein/cytochrome c-type biogenesis protein CcmH/NrfG